MITSLTSLRPNKRRKSLRHQLIACFLVFAIVPMALLSLITFSNARAGLIAKAEAQLLHESLAASRYIEMWMDYRLMDIGLQASNINNSYFLEFLSYGFERSKKSLDGYIYSDDWKRRVRRHETQVISVKEAYDYIYDIYLIDKNGNILYSVSRESDLGANILNGELRDTRFAAAVRETLTKGGMHFSDFERYAPSNNILCGFFTSRIQDSDGAVTGVYAVKARIDRLQEYLSQRGDVRHYLVGSDGRLRSPIDNMPDDILRRTINMSHFEKAKDGPHPAVSLTSDSSGTAEAAMSPRTILSYVGASGRATLGLAQPVQALNISWHLVSEIDRNLALSSVNWLGKITLILLLSTMIVVIVASIMLARSITQPIAELVSGVDRAAAGDLITPVTLSSDSEMSSLAKAFNRMISQRQKYETELVEATQIAQQASRAKSDFLAVMSHEIRTPMNGVLGMLTLLRHVKPGESIEHKVNVAYSSAQSLLSLINDILDFSKVEAGKLDLAARPFHLKTLLNDIDTSFAQGAVEKNIDLIFSTASSVDTYVVGDADRVRQILTNLIGNALKFTDRGQIVVSSELEYMDNNKQLCRFFCSIKDSGIGINASELDKLFDAFTQVDASTRRKYSGAGLGLAICKNLTELMGGTINVNSELGKGSEFYFDLIFESDGAGETPLVDDSEPSVSDNGLGPGIIIPSSNSLVAPQIFTVKKHRQGSAKRILIVEDNVINQQVVEAMLEDMNLPFDTVENGQQALEKLSNENRNSYFLVLMDCQMPTMDGYEATARIRSGEAGEHCRAIPIVAMTAHAMKGDREKCLMVGMNDYISKPLDDKDLMNVIIQWRQTTSKAPMNDDSKVTKNLTISVEPDQTSEQGSTPALRIPAHLKTLDLISNPPEVSSKKSLYLRLLRTYQSQAEAYRTRLVSQDMSRDDLINTAHTIKGTSANLGINEVRFVAAKFESILKMDPSADYHRELRELVSAIDSALKDLQQIFDLNKDTHDHDQHKQYSKDRAFPEIVAEVTQKLQQSAVIPPNLWEEFKCGLEASFSSVDTKKLLQAINAFDYDEALDMLTELQKKL